MNKDNVNTIIGIVILIFGAALTAAVLMGKIDGSDYGIALAALAAFGGGIIGIFSKGQTGNPISALMNKTGDHLGNRPNDKK